MNKIELDNPANNFGGQPQNVLVEKPLLNEDIKHVNGKYADPDEDEETEEDLVLGDENELEGDEMEFEVELEDDAVGEAPSKAPAEGDADETATAGQDNEAVAR